MQVPRDDANGATPSEPQRQVRSGAAVAFEEVYLQHALKLRKIAIRKFSIPPSEAETLVHDVFATYFTHASSVNAVEPYLVGAICNASRLYLRRAGAAAALFCGEAPCAATPGDALVDEISRKLLLSRMLARAGGRCRDLLRRYYYEGETTEAIAGAIGSTPGSVLVFLHKCRRRALAAYKALVEGC